MIVNYEMCEMYLLKKICKNVVEWDDDKLFLRKIINKRTCDPISSNIMVLLLFQIVEKFQNCFITKDKLIQTLNH